MPSPLKILIIGGHSMVGKRLLDRLGPNFEVRTAGRHPEDDVWFDLLEEGLAPELSQAAFDVVIHCAASFADNSPEGFLLNQKTNAGGALQVTRLLQAVGCNRLIYVSSISIFDHPENQYYGSYGLSKRHAQEMLELYARFHHIRFTALMLSQIYDDRGEAKKHQAFIYHLLEMARTNQECVLWGHQSPLRNLLFIEDVTTLIEKVIEQDLVGSYVCAHPQSPSILEIAKTAYEVFDHPPQIRIDPTQPNPPSIFVPIDFSIYERLNYFPQTDLKTGFLKYRQYVEGLKSCP
ncbi:NAD-dependent epimerase/dehydratase family protein [Vampirovibrio sp.]|uniref:NAD-dependent epimerase/dehydratase family protein n=1 Tax=Vampirovibrio sp. TaxID=2717857 RepID=UPI0035941B3C